MLFIHYSLASTLIPRESVSANSYFLSRFSLSRPYKKPVRRTFPSQSVWIFRSGQERHSDLPDAFPVIRTGGKSSLLWEEDWTAAVAGRGAFGIVLGSYFFFLLSEIVCGILKISLVGVAGRIFHW